ncbi:COG2236 Predicted phosphoribosyltransferases [uncultured Caudovirales phage]|uniref:COG2236 Predicted phosphoribosyltransferases n=1 Tax=uncultured Caudovirales phage TaxID=2100421 RepID=A0A6J5MG23_9CAUD|nr:COG2236 Predicted phosphoribosyltransferases [uncultured Caudovirales phage]
MIDATTIIDYDYDDFRAGIDHIAKSITASGWTPDYIVGIVRGGSIPAVYLSHSLKVPVVMVAWNTRDETIFGKECNTWIPEDLHDGKKILIVDDIVDGGDTIRELLDDWRKSTAGIGVLPVDNLRVAAMYYNTAQDVVVDFYHRTIDRNDDPRWIVFPWEA